MAREERGWARAEKQNPEPHSARGVNLSSYITIIGNCHTQVKIT
jgi:hypothetical protein